MGAREGRTRVKKRANCGGRVMRYSNSESVSVPGGRAEHFGSGRGRWRRTRMSGCEKKQKKKRNEIGSRHPLRFTRRTSRGALCSREVPARRGAAINFATVLDGTLAKISAEDRTFRPRHRPKKLVSSLPCRN